MAKFSMIQLISATTLFTIWWCAICRREWTQKTKDEEFKMMGFSPVGDDLSTEGIQPKIIFNKSFCPIDQEEYEWEEKKFSMLPQSVQRYLHRSLIFTGEENWEHAVHMMR
eukprot:876751_1